MENRYSGSLRSPELFITHFGQIWKEWLLWGFWEFIFIRFLLSSHLSANITYNNTYAFTIIISTNVYFVRGRECTTKAMAKYTSPCISIWLGPMFAAFVEWNFSMPLENEPMKRFFMRESKIDIIVKCAVSVHIQILCYKSMYAIKNLKIHSVKIFIYAWHFH